MAIDWTASMQQTYSFYKVDPKTWLDTDKITTAKDCTIERSSEDDTLGSASFTFDEIDGEFYVRVYLVAVQNKMTYREPLGTFLIQTPSTSFDGRKSSVSVDAYTPLIELTESYPPIGYTAVSGLNIMDTASNIIKEYARAPLIIGETVSDKTIDKNQNFTADTDNTWLTFIKDLISNADYELGLDAKGQIMYMPVQETQAMQPKWIYTDDNSSILQSSIALERDLYNVPNYVEVVQSTSSMNYTAVATNENSNSPTSIQNRGRKIVHRVINPDGMTLATKAQLDTYAQQLLKTLSSLEYTLTYTHGYCPVTVGDCVRLNYKRAGLTNIKAKVTRQSISCSTGCQVSETAVFTKNLLE